MLERHEWIYYPNFGLMNTRLSLLHAFLYSNCQHSLRAFWFNVLQRKMRLFESVTAVICFFSFQGPQEILLVILKALITGGPPSFLLLSQQLLGFRFQIQKKTKMPGLLSKTNRMVRETLGPRTVTSRTPKMLPQIMTLKKRNKKNRFRSLSLKMRSKTTLQAATNPKRRAPNR